MLVQGAARALQLRYGAVRAMAVVGVSWYGVSCVATAGTGSSRHRTRAITSICKGFGHWDNAFPVVFYVVSQEFKA